MNGKGKYLLALIILLAVNSSVMAQKVCDCRNDFDIKCDTTRVKNSGLLIRSCDADSIYYYFMPFRTNKKFTITSYEMELAGYDYRLGAAVDKQNKSYIRFKFGCTATGNLCLYKIYELRTGKFHDEE